MSRLLSSKRFTPSRVKTACVGGLFAAAAALLAACAGTPQGNSFGAQPTGPVQPATAVGTGQYKVGLILPLSASGNAGLAAQSMKNAAEMALTEFNSPNIQLLIKDDGGTTAGAQTAAQQALDEGAEIILGPLFAQTVSVVGQAARARGVPVDCFFHGRQRGLARVRIF